MFSCDLASLANGPRLRLSHCGKLSDVPRPDAFSNEAR
jgi:hypothetical protein